MGKILTKYFKDNDINYKAKWCISDDLVIKDIWSTRIKGLISRDIPAIIAIGPTSEDDIDKDGVKLYSRSKDDIYKKAVYNDCTYVKNHYFNVTAVIEDNVRKEINHFDGVMYEVSSWGSKYYMSEKEMNDFIENHTPLFTNLVYIKEK